MKFLRPLKKTMIYCSALSLFLSSIPGIASLYYKDKNRNEVAEWSSDSGLNPNDPLDAEMLDIYAEYPYMPEYSKKITGADKFRKDFGPTLWRAVLDDFQIIGMGQDATHIAEFAGRTATAGFGGRITQFMNHLGARFGIWINAFANTIKGQYGSFGSPMVKFDPEGKPSIVYAPFVDNSLWLMSMDLNSPMVKARNKIIDWTIRKSLANAKNGKNKAKLVALFGGAARDAMAAYVISKGGRVAPRKSEAVTSAMQVPMTKLAYAGGNNVFPVPLNKEGKDLYEELVGKKLDYKKLEDQKLAMDTLRDNIEKAIERMAFTMGGPNHNGILDPAQIGGYDLSKMYVNGEKTISLKGLILDDGTVIDEDILVVQFPHPSSLSKMTNTQASSTVESSLRILDSYKKKGWKINEEAGLKNKYHAGIPYRYGRSDIGPENYDFGTPRMRMVPVSTASRSGSDKITGGTRDRVSFEKAEQQKIVDALPAENIPFNEIIATKPSGEWIRYMADNGPGEKFEKMMKTLIDVDAVEAPKPGKDFKTHGMAAYNVKGHPESIGPMAYYRGSFKNPRVLILADPIDYNDIITSRALSGTRGQYIQGLMNQLGVEKDHLVLSTVPFLMNGANDQEWTTVLSQTKEYREKLIAEILSSGSVDLIITDGKQAAKEMARILGEDSDISVVNIQRAQEDGQSRYGIEAAGVKIRNLSGFEGKAITAKRANIPREHLPYLARLSDGIYGDLVIPAKKSDPNFGKAFQFIMPKHARNQKVRLQENADADLQSQLQTLEASGLELPKETIKTLYERLADAKQGPFSVKKIVAHGASCLLSLVKK